MSASTTFMIRGGRDVRVWIALIAGLVHGFGLANAWRAIDRPIHAPGWSLASFNVGVEIGQLLVVAALVSALSAVRARNEAGGTGRLPSRVQPSSPRPARSGLFNGCRNLPGGSGHVRSPCRRFSVAAVLVLAGQAPTAERQLAGRTAEEWINTLETPARLNSLKISETLGKLALKPGQAVADIGAGSGVFSPKAGAGREARRNGLCRRHRPGTPGSHCGSGHRARCGECNAGTVLGVYDNPDLPAEVDLAFINEVLHHIEHRAEYLKNLAAYLKPTGRVAIIEFKPGQGGHVNEPELQVSQEQVSAWMAAAGLKPVEEINLFDDKWFVIYGKG